ncbi:MAG: SDR family NAD(P)-dependent oxidoreductase, partial [Lachnospiraceae bacterium]|nr:SDR family NAD(P)-dependent oxidoreductase [Lachnospiraceae bacterium]
RLTLLGFHGVEKLQEICETFNAKEGISAGSFAGDLSDPAFVDDVFEKTNVIDLLVNCQGVSWVGLLQEMKPAEWDRVLDINLKSAYLTCRAAIPLMLQKKEGRIINISSIWGRVGASLEAAYSASKAGLNGLTMALAKELAPSGIAVNAIAPGIVQTRMNRQVTEEDLSNLRDEMPMGRFLSTEEIAQAVFHLSKMPLSLTGQILEIAGGWY